MHQNNEFVIETAEGGAASGQTGTGGPRRNERELRRMKGSGGEREGITENTGEVWGENERELRGEEGKPLQGLVNYCLRWL